MKTFKQFINESKDKSSLYFKWLGQDQAIQNPSDRVKLQQKVNDHFSDPSNIQNALTDNNSLHAAFILHQHMDNNPEAQQRFLDNMNDYVQNNPDKDTSSISARAKFLQDRINVNKAIPEIYNKNPDAYKDMNGQPLTDPVKDVRDTNKFTNKKFGNREDALADAKQNNPLLYKAVKAVNATTQPSYSVTWNDVNM